MTAHTSTNGIRAKNLHLTKHTKTERIKAHLLTGKPITGREMLLEYGYASYRDVIYNLRLHGWNIKSRMTGKGENRHAVYWLADNASNECPIERTEEAEA